MSDSENTPASAASTEATDGSAKSPLLRQLILIACLALVLGALYYDRQIARPSSSAKAEELLEKARERLYDEERGQLTPEEVAEILGKQPSKTEETEDYVKETYSWLAGLPFRSYFVVVAYSKSSGSPQYWTSRYNEEPTPNMLPGHIRSLGENEGSSVPDDLRGTGPLEPSPDLTKGSPDPTQGSPEPTPPASPGGESTPPNEAEASAP